MNKGFFIDQIDAIRPKEGRMRQEKNGEERGGDGKHPSSSAGDHFLDNHERF
jgi:hypothetical protein